MYEKLKNGDTEEKVQIGGSELTATEWKKLLTRIDKEIDVIKKDIKKEEETAKEKALKKANKEVVLTK
jgi:molecular chaperone GrpE (heat shock protein)